MTEVLTLIAVDGINLWSSAACKSLAAVAFFFILIRILISKFSSTLKCRNVCCFKSFSLSCCV